MIDACELLCVITHACVSDKDRLNQVFIRRGERSPTNFGSHPSSQPVRPLFLIDRNFQRIFNEPNAAAKMSCQPVTAR
jgi:hypothetical protein